MRRLLVLVCASACLLPAAPAAGLTARQVFGIGNTYDFGQPRLTALKPGATRMVANWNVARRPGFERDRIDQWYQRALGANLDPMLSFGGAADKRGLSVRRFTAAFRRALARWPRVGEWQTWNEGNHQSQPVTWRHPERAAAFAKAMERSCPRCTVIPVTLVLSDGSRTRWWIREFLKAYGRTPSIWSVHNYGDVNRRSNSRLRHFIRAHPRGRIWITETGAFAKFNEQWPFDLRRQGRDAPFALQQALRFRSRVDRVYWWQWRGAAAGSSHWDTGLVDPTGQPRPAYWSVLKARFRSP